MIEVGFDGSGTQFQVGIKGTLANPMAATWTNVAAAYNGFMYLWFGN